MLLLRHPNNRPPPDQPARVKRAVSTSTSFGGLPTSMDYHMTKKDEEVG